MASLFGAKNNGAKAQLAATSKVAHSTIAGHSVAIVAGLFIMALLKFFNLGKVYRAKRAADKQFEDAIACH
jgi:hypothetical protein